MGWYRRSKLVWDTFRNAAMDSKILARNPIPPLNSIKIPRLSNQSQMGVVGPSLLLSRCGHLARLNHTVKTPILDYGRRFYHVDRHEVYHFRPRGYKKWFENPKNVLIVVLLGSGCVITVYFGNLETIPYTKRTHFVLLSRDLEKQLGESQFKQIKGQYKGKILPAIHPDSVKVRLIAKDVIDALQRGVRHEQVWSDPDYSAEAPELHQDYGAHETLKALGEEKEFRMEGDWKKEEEILDDNWVKTSKKKGEARGAQSYTQHLDHVNWEVLVINDPNINAFCLPGGKIVVFTGLLKHFKTDVEMATVISHEVGHVVARHGAEQITKNLWLTILQLILYQFVTPDVVNTMSNLLLRLPFSRKMEIEADYIGVLLMASAGYDPRAAPSVYEKLGQLGGDSSLRDYLSTHPSGKRRAQLLAEAQVMQEAMNLYKERISGHGIEGFLVFGTWPLAKLAGARKKVRVEGPVCRSSQVVGWRLKKASNQTEEELQIPISNFAFNSSILWDPERWGRLSPTKGAKQNLLKFVKQAVVDDESRLKGVPQDDCSKINLWQLHLSNRAYRK